MDNLLYIKSESTQSKAREEDVSLWSRLLPLLVHSPDPSIPREPLSWCASTVPGRLFALY